MNGGVWDRSRGVDKSRRRAGGGPAGGPPALVDVRELAPDVLGSRIGIVPQAPYLFSGTVATNLRYGNPDATEEQILAAARATYVDRFVHSLPNGYQTWITDDGGNISAGEKQQIIDNRREPFAFRDARLDHPGRARRHRAPPVRRGRVDGRPDLGSTAGRQGRRVRVQPSGDAGRLSRATARPCASELRSSGAGGRPRG